MVKTLIISLNSGGTMGHGRIITSLSNKLIDAGEDIFIASEIDYSKSFDLNSNVKVKLIPETNHVNYTIGGMYEYKHKSKILEICDDENIKCVLFSTFFDIDLVKDLKNKNIKVILLSYPIRDTYREALKLRKVYELFDRVISLYDPSVNESLLENEILANPLDIVMKSPKKEDITTDILLTCGGGGRPSSKILIKKTLKCLEKLIDYNKEIRIKIINGNSPIKEKVEGIEFIHWSKDIENLINSSKIIISEAGYFTMLDLINCEKESIFVPGERIIDNQELRALCLERLKVGHVFFPFENEEILLRMINDRLNKRPSDKSNFYSIRKIFLSYSKLIDVILKELK